MKKILSLMLTMSIFALNFSNAQITETKLLPSDPENVKSFGYSVAMDGDVLVTGCGGANYLGPKTGVALIFHYSNGEWVEDTILLPNDWMDAARFGWSVDVQDDYVFISSIHDGANGLWAGAVYIYKYDSSTELWYQQQKLVPSDIDTGDEFGNSVSVSGDRLLVGARGENGNVGAAYVFNKVGSEWVEDAKLTSEDYAGDEPYFGQSVCIDGDYAIVGAPYDETYGNNSGSAFVFHFDGSNWVLQQKLISGDINSNDYFGRPVSISGDYAMVGAIGNMTQPNSHGAVYAYKWDGIQWLEQQKLYDSNVTINIGYGVCISMEDNLAIIGAPEDIENGVNAGAVYIYEINGGSWTEVTRLLASDGMESDKLGWSVDMDNGRAIAGAVRQHAGGQECGAVYIFEGFASAIPESPEVLNISLYPVPATTTLRLKIQDTRLKTPEIKIYDIAGQVVMSKQSVGEEIDVNGLAPGMYFLRLRVDDRIGIQKLIIQ